MIGSIFNDIVRSGKDIRKTLENRVWILGMYYVFSSCD